MSTAQQALFQALRPGGCTWGPQCRVGSGRQGDSLERVRTLGNLQPQETPAGGGLPTGREGGPFVTKLPPCPAGQGRGRHCPVGAWTPTLASDNVNSPHHL